MRIPLPHRGWLLDLDGTVYLGDRLVPGADTAVAALRAAGRRVAFLSNKPLETRDAYARKLARLGVPAAPDDVVTSSLVLARHLRRLDPDAPVFVIGEAPLRAELAAHGFEVRPDAAVRWVLAVAFILVAAFYSAQPLVSLAAALAALIMAGTALTRTCPLYRIFGISTCAPKRG